MGSTTILRGFKVSVATLDAFLIITQAGGTADKKCFRVMIPSREGHDRSTVAYVTWSWATLYVHREIVLDYDLPGEIPAGFEELRREMLSYGEGIREGEGGRLPAEDEGKIGLYIVYTHDIRGIYTPQAILARYVYCDYYDAVFEESNTAFEERRLHLINFHGSELGLNPLPDA
ncbi:hypothetical protein VMCG_09157 [Cytospora schulzeri]|uniref:Uncharacterized protein n=1 Tax=Cytospora schulzeri TaxID=448051 RepID=A0A423VLI0_9PEZI|nr:hypothetical protein VMCG_09157 [Valsa malicola]